MLDDAMVEKLRRHWDEGWNAGHLATIMEPFAPGVVFSSPFVPRLTGDPAKASIEGYAALRSYVDHALRRTPGIRYTLEATYAGTDAVVLVYTCRAPDGTVRRGADSMRVDATGQVVEWRCHYSHDSMG
ncbi:nuclear transport factor 2 family protein [Actinomadura craniellae]|uniref:Nuclear transport factor 2 family protein n=1 Tax=Actinomadura craniellae TaxID=2231787 RepID=A0A365H0S1_9ACTN|nr:nuclear transport factor 2 family protein [Actinomadura craniellae]RAY12661.1 nuclear transport factor 2 family protein [Actinomadura craniellae]